MTQLPNEQNDVYKSLAANQYGPSVGKIARGSLVAFNYPNSWAIVPNIIHDPYPLVIISDIWPSYIRGVNLHYLTFPYIKNLLQGNSGNTSFSYYNIKGDNYLKNAFRMYVRVGMRRVKVIDSSFLLTVLGTMRSFAPGEIDNMKRYIQEQLSRQMNPKVANIMNDIMTGGVQRGLTYPQMDTGPNAANISPDQGNV